MEPVTVNDLIEYSNQKFTSKVIFRGPSFQIVLFAFIKGQKLPEHTTPSDVFLHVVEGEAMVSIDGNTKPVKQKEMIKLPKDIPHAIIATTNCKMMLIK